jgi:hypothetical protein
VVGLRGSHSVLALEHGDLVHISRARIGAWAQRRDCVGQGRLEGLLMKDAVGSRRSSQILAQAARMDSVRGELVAVERVASVAKEQAVSGTLRGQQVDKIEVSMVLATGNMGSDVMSAGKRRLETHMSWTWGRY